MAPTLRSRSLSPQRCVSSMGTTTPTMPISTPPRGTKRRRVHVGMVTPEPVSSCFMAEALFCSSSSSSSFFRPNDDDKEFWDLKVSPEELRPSATLTTGQSFVWKDVTVTEEEDAEKSTKKVSAWGTHDAREWIGTLRTSTGDSLVVQIRETPQTTLYRIRHHVSPKNNNTEPLLLPQGHYDAILKSYFQLNVPLQPLYQEWSTQCNRMQNIAKCIPGVRILRQDPWECLISFICSSNNNIPRITSMLQSIRRSYGRPMGYPDDKAFCTFPTPHELSVATEQELRTVCGLGYRAKYILQTTQLVLDWGGEAALLALRDEPHYTKVQAKLLELPGVGPKVADCVALFSLDQDTSAIPVDVHVWNICMRDYAAKYDPSLSEVTTKSLTPTLYKRVQHVFRQQFPTKTAWAHSLLFVAELPSFRPALPPHVLQEMDEFKRQEQEKKKQTKANKS